MLHRNLTFLSRSQNNSSDLKRKHLFAWMHGMVDKLSTQGCAKLTSAVPGAQNLVRTSSHTPGNSNRNPRLGEVVPTSLGLGERQ